MHNLCFRCRGRDFCKRGHCVLREKIKIHRSLNENASKDFSGENYNVFVGKHGYPDLNVGMLNTPEQVKDDSIDNPLKWSREDYDINSIISRRSGLINSNFKMQVRSSNGKFLDIVKELSLASRPVDTEVSLEKKPQFKLTLDQEMTPFGPSIKLEKARITENVKIPHKVESITNDDIPAREGLSILYQKGFDEHYLTKVFSMGNLGNDANKRIVPTRWSITAVDDTLGKEMISEIKDYKMADYSLYFGGYLGNYYIIILFPDSWSYELFETLVRTGDSAHDIEGYHGRKQYAYETAGGYYAARFSILQQLCSIKRQAKVLALRFVTDEYWVPLGVWVVREAVKKAMSNAPTSFDSKEEMLKYAQELAHGKLKFDITGLIAKSGLLKDMEQQKKLWEY